MANALDYFDPQLNSLFNTGYSHGYNGHGPVLEHMAYIRGYLTGAEDRASDEMDMASGQLDHLSDAERAFLYGQEERGVHYR